MQHVLVLNASYEPLNVCTVRRAHVLLFKGKAEIVEQLDQPLRSASGTFIWPHVIRLLNYVRVPRAIQRKISRKALFARDGWRCVYCGTASGRLTLDHVVPRSKGGESVWENVARSGVVSTLPAPVTVIVFVGVSAEWARWGWATPATAAAPKSTRTIRAIFMPLIRRRCRNRHAAAAAASPR